MDRPKRPVAAAHNEQGGPRAVLVALGPAEGDAGWIRLSETRLAPASAAASEHRSMASRMTDPQHDVPPDHGGGQSRQGPSIRREWSAEH